MILKEKTNDVKHRQEKKKKAENPLSTVTE